MPARKKTSKALKDSKNRYRAYFNLPTAGIAITSPDKGWVDVNSALCEMLGYTQEELSCRTWSELTYPEDLEADVLRFERVLTGEIDSYSLEKRFIRKDQTIIWVDLSVHCVRSETGAVSYFIALLKDITGRKTAEQALRENEAQLRGIIDNLQDAYFRADLSGHLTVVSPSAVQMFRYESVEEMIGLAAKTLYARQEDRKSLLEEVRRCKRVNDWVSVAKRKDGSKFWVSMSVQIYCDSSGKVSGSEGIVRDITERKVAEETLRLNEERLSLAQTVAHVGTFNWDLITGVNTWTSELEAMYGLQPGSFAQTQPAWENLVHPEDREQAVKRVNSAFETGHPTEGEWRVIWPDQSIHWIAGRWQVLKDESGKPIRMVGVNIDMTERKRIDEETARLASFPILNPNPIIEADLEGNVLYANPCAQRLFPKLQVLGQKHPYLMGWTNLQNINAKDGRAVARDVMVTDRWYNQTIHFLRDSQRIRIYGLDITERKIAEHALRESEERFRNMADSSPVMIWVTEPEGECSFLSKSWEEFTGQTLSEGLGFGWVQAVHPEDRPNVELAFRRGNDAHGHYQIEYRLKRKNGLYGWVIDTAAPRFDAQKTFLGYVGSVVNITERKQKEEELFNSRQYLQTLMNAIPVGIAISADTTCNKITGNPAMLAQFEVAPGANISASATDPAEAGSSIRYFKNGRELTGGELPMQRAIAENRDIPRMELDIELPSGRRISTIASGVPIRDQGGNIIGAVAVSMDITERKQAEDIIRRANEELEARVQERTSELAVRANQLRALAGELTISEQRERKRLANLLHDHLQQLLVGAKYRLTVLSNRVADDGTKLAAKEIEALIDEAIRSSRSLTAELSPPILHDAGLTAGLEWLGRRVADTHGLFVYLKAEQIGPLPEDLTIVLFEAVRELLFNVTKHADTNSAAVILRQIDNFLEIAITDQGVGFDPNDIPPAGGTGSGFGLFSLRERLELFGGKLMIDSAPGRGSRFMIAVPITKVESKPSGLAELPGEIPPKLMPIRQSEKKIRVLLADDHGVVRQGIANLLSDEEDLEVVGAAIDGQDAVNLAAKLVPDVILMDMNMPRLNGVEATRIIHRDYSNICIIGLSMFEEAEKAQAMRDAGAVNYLTKSGPAEELISAIRAVVGRSQKAFAAKS